MPSRRNSAGPRRLRPSVWAARFRSDRLGDGACRNTFLNRRIVTDQLALLQCQDVKLCHVADVRCGPAFEYLELWSAVGPENVVFLAGLHGKAGLTSQSRSFAVRFRLSNFRHLFIETFVAGFRAVDAGTKS